MKMEKDVVIEVTNVAKDFHLPRDKSNSIKTKIVKIFNKKDTGADTQHALKDISFKVKKGEFFGIVGRNGSGKSTLLKIISQIYKPTKGSVKVNGRLVPFIELGVGFNPELTGRENVFLNGALLGFTRKEIEAQYSDIVEFAELEDFMDQKLKNYSSGMQVRLAFSVAIRADSDILILDEVLAVGDEAFQRKCNDYFFKAKRQGKTVVLVTHSMESVRQFCDRAVLIEDGLIKEEGNPDKVASQYSKIFIDEYAKELSGDSNETPTRFEGISNGVKVKQLSIEQDQKITKTVNFRENFSVKFSLESEKDYGNLVFAVHMIDQAGRIALELSTKSLSTFGLRRGETGIDFNVQNIFTEGEYYLNYAIRDKDTNSLLIKEQEKCRFGILGIDTSIHNKDSLTHPDVEVRINGDAVG